MLLFADSIIIDSFTDHISAYESAVFREALVLANTPDCHFSSQMKEALIGILSARGCREMPTPGNIRHVILQVAQYELLTKPFGALLSLYRGVPKEYRSFFGAFSVEELYELYKCLNATPGSVLAMIAESDDFYPVKDRRIPENIHWQP